MSVTLETRPSLAAARAFYCDALRGRQLRRRKHDDDSGALCFRVGEDLVTTGPAATGARVTLVVDDVVAVAARCWDAGFTVYVRDSGNATTIAVMDPFDLEVELLSEQPLAAMADRYELASAGNVRHHSSR